MLFMRCKVDGGDGQPRYNIDSATIIPTCRIGNMDKSLGVDAECIDPIALMMYKDRELRRIE